MTPATTEASDGIQIEDLTKRFGRGSAATMAVEELSFTVSPGRITGFLGPNGAGKTTTLRCILGLVSATSGSTLVAGKPYGDLKNPAEVVGAVLESTGFNPGRTARNHLRIRARAIGAAADSVDELLQFVGLEGLGDRRVGAYSLGMRQRLGLAMALIGKPNMLILDEPGNGLDPGGIAWLRTFLKRFAADGGTVLVSSHLLSEVRQSVDDIVIINKGRLVRSSSLDSLLEESGCREVKVSGPDLKRLVRAVVERGGTAKTAEETATPQGTQEATICGMRANEVGHLAHTLRTELHWLTETESDLEQLFLQITEGEA
jgi:ABC-2 type transport system ATP-binding protein